MNRMQYEDDTTSKKNNNNKKKTVHWEDCNIEHKLKADLPFTDCYAVVTAYGYKNSE